MSLPKETMTIAIVASILSSASGVTTLQKSHLFPNDNHELFYDYQSFYNTSFVYALCEKSNVPIKKCAMILENYSFDRPLASTFCNVNLEFDKQEYSVSRAIRVIQFGSDKAVIVWWETWRDTSRDAFAKLSILHFSSCSVREIELAVSGVDHARENELPFATIVTTYDDTFDVVFPNRELCEDKLCRITYDADGRVANDLIVWSKDGFESERAPLTFVLPMSRASPLHGSVVVEQRFSQNTVQLFRYRNNHFQLLASRATGDTLSYKVSTANSKIGVCLSSVNKTVDCLQFDSGGKLVLNKTLALDQPSKQLSLHNGRDGGFLLLTSRNIGSDAFFDYDVSKYEADGSENGTLNLGGFHCPLNTVAWLTFFESEKEEYYCASFSCLHPYNVPVGNKKNYLIFKVKCFEEREMKRKVDSTSLRKTRGFADHRLYVGGHSVDDTSVIYALCDPREKSCSVVVEKYSFDREEATRMSSCDVDLDDKERVELISLGKGGVIVAYCENNGNDEDYVDVVFAIIHFSSNCKIAKNKVSLLRDGENAIRLASLFVVYEDSFNVVYPNDKLCGERYCRETYNADGDRISGPSGWMAVREQTSVTLLPVHDRSPLLGHAILESERIGDGRNLTISFSNNEGLKQIQSDAYDESVGWIHSNVHNKIGVCLDRNESISCEQFDSDGNKQLNATLDTAGYGIDMLAMHNLPSGGFLLLSDGRIRCLGGGEATSDDEREYYVTKFDKDGRKSTSLRIARFECEDERIAKFFERSSDEYCASFTCARVYSSTLSDCEGRLDFEAKCFSVKDL